MEGEFRVVYVTRATRAYVLNVPSKNDDGISLAIQHEAEELLEDTVRHSRGLTVAFRRLSCAAN